MKIIHLLTIVIFCCFFKTVQATEIFQITSVIQGRYAADTIINKNGFTYAFVDATSDGIAGKQLGLFSFKWIDRSSFHTEQKPSPETLTLNLKPNDSDIPFGLNDGGYIEQIWPTGEDDSSPLTGFLFATEIYPDRTNYLYKAIYTPFGPVSVGNNPMAYDNQRAIFNLGERNGAQANIRPMHQRSLLSGTDKYKFLTLKTTDANGNSIVSYYNDKITDANGKPIIYYGDYYNNDGKVTLWKSADFGGTWNKIIEWQTDGFPTLHINAVVQNPNNKWIYILFGDNPNESAIVAWDGVSAPPPDNTPLDQMGDYPGWKSITGVNARAGDLLFTQGKCVWIPEVDPTYTGKIFGQRANFDLSQWETTGEVPYTVGQPPVIGATFRGARSDLTQSPNLYWASYRDQQDTENKISVWKSNDQGLSWFLASKLDVFATETATPINFSVGRQSTTDNSILDLATLFGRALNFVRDGKAISSMASFSSQTILSSALPVTNPDSYTIVPSTTQTTFTLNVGSNDSNVQDSQLVVQGEPGHGSITPSTVAGEVVYTPNPGFVGTDTFSYALKNSEGTSNTSIVTITIPITPKTNPDSFTIEQASTTYLVTGRNDENPRSGVIRIISSPSHGIILHASLDGMTYRADPNFVGIDTFTYAIESLEGTGLSNTSTVTINITPSPQQILPQTTPDMATVVSGQPIDLDLSANDSNLQNIAATETIIINYPQNGSVDSTSACCGHTSYTSSPDFGGIDTFSYAFKNLAGTSNTSEVRIYVLNAKQDNYTVKANGSKEQTFCKSVKDGVARNDLPKEGVTYTFDNSVILPNPGNQVAATVNGQANGAFCFTMTVPKLDSQKRHDAKRGVYQLNYNMNLNGVSAPGTALITVQ